jgi:probable F420-dependent oxidoreductase
MRVFVTLGPDQQAVAVEARAAESAGFDGVSTGEHLFFHGAVPNAFVSLAAAAGATERLRLLSSLSILPLYPAALAAKLATSLDQVSGGRFDMGIGVGGEYPAEFIAAGVPVEQRGQRTDEALAVLTSLWSGQTINFHGPFSRIPGLRIQPGPIQQGGPPLWLGGRRPAAIRRAGRYADVWLPHMYSPQQLANSLGSVREQAERQGRDPTRIRAGIHCWGGVDYDASHSRHEVISAVSEVYQQDFTYFVDRYLLHGTPERVRARISEYRDAGATEIVFCPVGTGDRRRDIIDLFAHEVLPAIGSDQNTS